MYHYLLLAVALLLTACPSMEVLQPAHDMAVENVQNLDANIGEAMKHYLGLAKTHPTFVETDLPKLEERVATIAEQVAILVAYVVLVDQAIKGSEVDKDTYLGLLQELPKIIEEGTNIWAEIEAIFKKEDE